MSRGYVYVLTNQSMPNIVKVGMTTRSVEQRMNELYQTGVPEPFDLFSSYLCPDCAEVESWVHNHLSDCRLSDAREFFMCSAEEADRIVSSMQREQVSCWVDDFIPNSTVVESDVYVDQSDLIRISEGAGVGVHEICGSFHMMTPEEIMPPVERFRALVKSRGEKE